MTALEKQQKKISVIIPVYNAEKYIRETLDSIIKQSYTGICYASFSSVYGMNREVPYAVEDQVDNSVILYALPKER